MQLQHYSTERKMQVLTRYASSDEQLKDILADEEIPNNAATGLFFSYTSSELNPAVFSIF